MKFTEYGIAGHLVFLTPVDKLPAIYPQRSIHVLFGKAKETFDHQMLVRLQYFILPPKLGKF